VEHPRLQDQFADLSQGLSTITDEEWNDIPDIGDYSLKRQRVERFTPLPDKLIEAGRMEGQVVGTVDDTVQVGGYWWLLMVIGGY